MKTLRYAKRLIGFNSVSHESNRLISKYIERKLNKYGFVTERLEYRDKNLVPKVNIVAKKGTGTGGLAYFAHTDVVPAEQWFTDKFGPFEPTAQNEKLYGRGACDMKGSIACMLAAIQDFSVEELRHPIYFTCTADEEVGYSGAKQVVEESKFYREMVTGGTHAIIGEPTQLEVVHAHKGAYGFQAVAKGKAAHSSTRNGVNANLAMIPFLQEMKAIYDETESDPQWQDASFSPPTVCWNIGVNDHNSALNVTSPESICTVYFRPMPNQDPQPLIDRAESAANKYGLYFDLDRQTGGFFTDPESEYVQTSLGLAHKGRSVTASYGTDGGVFSELEKMIVIGPGSIAQAHTDSEWISFEQLQMGTELYGRFIRRFCC